MNPITKRKIQKLPLGWAIAATLLSASLPARAADKRPTRSAIPDTATVLFQANDFDGRLVDDDGAVVAGYNVGSGSLAQTQCNAVQGGLRLWRKQAEAQDADFKCQTIYREWVVAVYDENNIGIGSYPPAYRVSNFELTTYCDPRDLVQQQVLSLKRACEQQPMQECFSEQFLERIKQLQPTRYVDVNRPSCDPGKK